jgi:sarcosine oxidase subunit gamma
VTLAEVDIRVAWNVRGDAARPEFASSAQRLIRLPLPIRANSGAHCDGAALLWLGPGSWLFIGHDARGDFDDARTALNTVGGALFDVSSSYVGWAVSGTAAARMLNRGCPLDLDPRVFAAGACAQSVLGHVNALLYRPDDRSTFVVFVARSFAADAWRSLCDWAATDGYRIAPSLSFAAVLRAGA